MITLTFLMTQTRYFGIVEGSRSHNYVKASFFQQIIFTFFNVKTITMVRVSQRLSFAELCASLIFLLDNFLMINRTQTKRGKQRNRTSPSFRVFPTDLPSVPMSPCYLTTIQNMDSPSHSSHGTTACFSKSSLKHTY